jgi:hypothetical protein
MKPEFGIVARHTWILFFYSIQTPLRSSPDGAIRPGASNFLAITPTPTQPGVP